MSRTIYVDFDGENGPDCFGVLTHAGDPSELDEKGGVSGAWNMGEYGVAIVDDKFADRLTDQLDHAPGCSVRGYENH